MDGNLREQFELTVGDGPRLDAGEMAQAAIVAGGRVRRRRRQVAAAGVVVGVAAVVSVVAGLNLRSGAPDSAPAPVTVAAAMLPVAAPSCSEKAVESNATDVALFLNFDSTPEQKSALASKLEHDARVRTMVFENRATAYERFRNLWADSPDFVDSVSPAQLPEVFRVRLVDDTRYTGFRADYAAVAGVGQIVGRTCPTDAPVGGIQ